MGIYNPSSGTFTAPSISFLTTIPSRTGTLFNLTVAPASSLGAGATYTDSGSNTFTVVNALTTSQSGWVLVMSGTAVATAGGTLTKVTGTGPTTLTYGTIAGTSPMATYTAPTSPSPLYYKITAVGAGAGGGGAANVAANAGASGGGGGGTSISFLSASTLGASQLYAVGTGGTGGAGGGNNGGINGTAASLGGLVTATGGMGGNGSGANGIPGQAAAGGNNSTVPGVGQLIIQGGASVTGGPGIPAVAAGNGGSGGSSAYGGCGAGTTNTGTAGPGGNYGGGGAGGEANTGGAAGAGGIVIVEAYYQ